MPTRMAHCVVLTRVDQPGGQWSHNAACQDCDWAFTGVDLQPHHVGRTDALAASLEHMTETKGAPLA